MKKNKMLIIVLVSTAFAFALSSCSHHTCPTYSQAKTQAENNG